MFVVVAGVLFIQSSCQCQLAQLYSYMTFKCFYLLNAAITKHDHTLSSRVHSVLPITPRHRLSNTSHTLITISRHTWPQLKAVLTLCTQIQEGKKGCPLNKPGDSIQPSTYTHNEIQPDSEIIIKQYTTISEHSTIESS